MNMLRRMKAGIYSGPQDIKIEEIPIPAVKPGHVLVDNIASGICGSDLHRYFGEWDQPKVKVATGHEFSGVVVEVGTGVTDIVVGDRVCPECFSHCGQCTFCRIGQYNLCENIRYLSAEGPGGFAEYSLLSASSVFKLPDSISFEEGALIEPLAVSYRSVLRTSASHKDRMFIFGAGTIGLFCLAVAKVIGVREVIISAKYEHQAKMAEKLGVDYVMRVPTQDVENEIKTVSKTKNGKVDVVIDTIATEQTFHDALSTVRKAGTVCLVGGYTKPLNASLRPIVSKELHVLGSACYSYSGIKKDFDAVIDIIATKKIDVIPLITHRFPLNEIEEAFKIAADKISGSIKVLINQ